MNIPFIKYLGEKLKTGNLRSIHLNALPGRYLTRLDLTRLDDIQALQSKKKTGLPLSHTFIFNNLLRKEHFKFLINFKGISIEKLAKEDRRKLDFIARRLNGIFNQDEDNYLEHGVRTFSFGYPLLIKKSKKDGKRVIKSPIFIWSLDIKRSTSRSNEWTIVKTPDAPIYINQVLIAHINQDEGIVMDNLHPEYLEDSKIDKFEMAEIIEEVLNHFRDFNINIKPKIEATKASKTIDSKASEPNILWSGVFGLFKTQKQSIIQDIDQLAVEFDNKSIIVEPFKNSKNAAVETDPSQQEIIHSITKTECKVIQGPPGTGKSQSITAIITNALENHKKILVVCEKKTALEVIENNLKDIGLAQLCTTIDDVNRDRKKIIDHVRSLEKNGMKVNARFSEINYDNNLKQLEELTDKVNVQHHHLLKKVLNDQDTQQLIAEHIRLQRAGFVLRFLLDDLGLELNGEEYAALNLVVRQAADLFEAVKKPCFLLDKYAGSRFMEQYQVGVEKRFFQDIRGVEKFALAFVEHWEELTFKENNLAKDYSINNQKWTKFKAYFLKSHKMVVKHWVSTHELYQQIKTALLKNKLLAPPKSWTVTTDNLTEVKAEIKELQLFTGESSLLRPHFRGYYHWRYFFESQPPAFQKVLKSLRENVSNTKDWLSVFTLEYFDLFLSEKETEIGPFNENNQALDKIIELQKTVKKEQKDKILRYWSRHQNQKIRDFNTKSNIKWLFNYRKNSKYSKRNSLRKIVQEEFELFSTIFPVLLVSPVVCSSVLPLKKGLFDLVIFDEASQLRLEDTFSAFYRGKIKVISGDKQQMPPSSYFASDILLETNDEIEAETGEEQQAIDQHDPLFLAGSESLLEFGNKLNSALTNVSYLDFHYRSKHPYLIDFSNAAFYGKRLVPIPSMSRYQPIRFIQVDGLYQDASNLAEAEKVIEVIRTEILPYKNGRYPSLGIATFNMTQRNLIKDLIYSTAVKDKAFREKMNLINQTDEWFVKNLENIQGDERDIIIISTTFGINKKEKFIQNFGPLNNFERGYKLLNVIITRAKKKLYLLTSIPQDYYIAKYQREIERKGVKGKAVLYAYLDYCQSVEELDEPRRQAVLELLSQNSEDSPHYETITERDIHPFQQLIFEYLSDHIDPHYIAFQYPFGGYQIDMVILDELFQPKIAIECDGTTWHNTNEAYIYDLHRQKIFENYGLKYHRIWTKNWWHAPEKAAIKLITSIAETMPFVLKKEL